MPDIWSSPAAVARHTIAVAGSVLSSIQNALIALATEERRDGSFSCEMAVNNWNSSGTAPGYLFADSAIFALGRQLQVKIGSSVVFAGTISRISTAHVPSGTHMLTILAESKPVTPARRRVAKNWSVTLGRSLSEASISIEAGGINGSVIAEVNGALRVGDLISINGLPEKFDGAYAVTEVRHQLDLQSGLRTAFSINRPV